MALVPLVARPDVDEDVRRAVLEQAVRLGRRDLVDLGPSLGEKLPVGRHYFPEYSGRTACTATTITAWKESRAATVTACRPGRALSPSPPRRPPWRLWWSWGSSSCRRARRRSPPPARSGAPASHLCPWPSACGPIRRRVRFAVRLRPMPRGGEPRPRASSRGGTRPRRGSARPSRDGPPRRSTG